MAPSAQPFVSGKRHKVPLPTLEVLELTFTGNIALKAWPGGAALPAVVWKKVGNPDKPVCYLKGSNTAKLTALIRYASPALTGKAKVSLRAVSTAPALEFRKDGVTLAEDADTSVAGIPIVSGKLPDKVQKTALELEWSVSYDKGTTWTPIQKTGPHTVYQTVAAPLVDDLFDFALEKVSSYVKGDPDPLGKINLGIPKDLKYDPSEFLDDEIPLGYYDHVACLCMNNAMLMAYLANSIGIPATVKYIWGGDAPNNAVFYIYRGGRPDVTFRVMVRGKDFAPPNPHFTYHAQTEAGGVVYDPSYGNVGLINLAETAPGCTRQTGSAWPPANILGASWKCPH